MKELLRELCTLDAVNGYEDEVIGYITKRVKPHADQLIVDALGDVIVFKKGKNRREQTLMVCAHMDEVGFLVHRITDDGMLKLAQTGSIDPRVLIGRRMRVGEKKIPGVISIKAIHLTTPEERKSAPPLSQLYIDIGVKSKAEAEKLVQIGDPAVFASDFIEFGDNCVKAKAIDDRVGCAVMLKLIESELEYDTWFVFSTGEEIGGRGARIAAQRINPDLCLVIEGTTANDIPEIPEQNRSTSHRKGAVVSLADGGTLYYRPLIDLITKAADQKGIKWQYRQSLRSGTDAGKIHTANAGCKAFGLSAPVRYIHSACNVVHLPDVEEVLKLAQLFVKETGENHV